MASTQTTNTVSRHVKETIASGTAITAPLVLGTFSGNLIPNHMAITCDVAGGLATLDLKVRRTGETAAVAGDDDTSIAQFAVSAGAADFQMSADVMKQLLEFIAEDDRVQYGTEIDLVLVADAATTADVTVNAALGFIDRV